MKASDFHTILFFNDYERKAAKELILKKRGRILPYLRKQSSVEGIMQTHHAD
jgi:hypothetical protein